MADMSEFCYDISCGKTRVVGLPDLKKMFEDMISIEYTNITDGQTVRHRTMV